MKRTGLRPATRSRLVLVFAVLAGVLAMHALAPCGMPAMGRHAAMKASVSMHHDAAHPVPAGHAQAIDAHGDSHPADTGGMVHHADAACAADGTSTAYAPPALAVDARWPTVSPAPGGERPVGDVEGRAPPDLAQLQLLRI